MRVILEARIKRTDGTRQTVEVFALERALDPVPSCGIGLLLSESRDLVGNLQSVVLREQANELITPVQPLLVKRNGHAR